MKAVIQPSYGSPDVLRIVDVGKPSPKEAEVLVKIQAASVNAYDWHLLTADIFLVRLMGGAWFKPKSDRPGADISGVVEAVGAAVSQFKIGDEVYGDIAGASGGFAEYAAVPESLLAPRPANLTFEQAAAVPMAGITALQGLRDVGSLRPGQKVLIQGASGGVGTFAVQIAKAFGAEVTAVCSTHNLEQARSLGADDVIDYTREDFTTSGKKYDLILAANGYHPLADYRRALTSRGIYVMAGGKFRQILGAGLSGSRMSEPNGRQIKMVSAKHSQADLLVLKEMIEAGKVKPVMDRVFPFSQTAEALRYLGTGHARGKVVIRMQA